MNQIQTEDRRKVFADIQTANIDNTMTIVGASIQLCSEREDLHWKWNVEMKDFELFVEIDRAVSQIVDTLCAALRIRKAISENNVSWEILNGTCLLSPVSDSLTKLYEKFFMRRYQFMPDDEMEESVIAKGPCVTTFSYTLTPSAIDSVFPEGFCKPKTLSFEMLVEDIEVMKKAISDNRIDQAFLDTVSSMLQLCDCIKTMCTVYFYFVHRVWVISELEGGVTKVEVDIARLRTFNRVKQEDKKFSITFSSFFAENFELCH